MKTVTHLGSDTFRTHVLHVYIQPRPVDSLIFVIYLLTIRTLFESFAFEPSTAIAFKSWNLQADESIKAPSVQRFEARSFRNCRFLILVILPSSAILKRSTVWQLWDFKDLKAIAVEGSNAKLSKSVQRRTLWDFDVERSELPTSNALRFRRRTIIDFDVERSEISTSNAQRFRRRMLIDFEFYSENRCVDKARKDPLAFTPGNCQTYPRIWKAERPISLI